MRRLHEPCLSHIFAQPPSKKYIDPSGGQMDSWGDQERMNDSGPVKQQNPTLPPHPRSLPWKCLASLQHTRTSNNQRLMRLQAEAWKPALLKTKSYRNSWCYAFSQVSKVQPVLEHFVFPFRPGLFHHRLTVTKHWLWPARTSIVSSTTSPTSLNSIPLSIIL